MDAYPILYCERLVLMERSQSFGKLRRRGLKWKRLAGIKQALSQKLQTERRRRRKEKVPMDVREGHVAVYTASTKERRRRRFVIPLAFLSHPAFRDLLRMAEEEFGFEYTAGGLTIPCDPLHLQDTISVLMASRANNGPPYSLSFEVPKEVPKKFLGLQF